MILRETLGLSADGSTKAYKQDDIKSFYTAVPLPITYNPRRPQDNQLEFFVAVDPSGGGPSAFSICSMLVTKENQSQVTARRSEPPHMLHTTLAATTSRSGF